MADSRHLRTTIGKEILEFDKVDPIGTTFRYPDDETNALYCAEFWIDFAQLKYVMGIVFEALDRAVWTLEQQNDLPQPSWYWRERKRQTEFS
jgi:hypothetical protein